ncbi:MAG: discoidin domain-containing protein, partial [Kiritimatiellia bacterium]
REAGEGRFFVRLASVPTENVVFAVARTAGDTNVAVLGGASLTFKPTTWDVWQAVTLAAGADGNAADETATFRVSAPSYADAFVTATALDKDLGVNWALAANGSTIAGVRASLPGQLIDGIHQSSANYGYTAWTNSLGLPPGTMTLDLKVATELARVRLQNYDWSYRPNRYKIESSLDGAGWSPLIDASTGDRSGWDDWALAGQSVRYLRFTGLSNAASFAVCVAELEVYGTRPENRRAPASAAAEAAETESVPVTVLTSDGPEDESGWAAVDGNPETAWVGQKPGGGYVVVEYAPTLTLRALEVDLAEGSLTNIDYLFSHDAIDWQPLPEGLETNPISLNFLWLVFPDDGSAAVPEVIEIDTNP